MRMLSTSIAIVAGFTAFMLGIMGDGATSLALVAISIGLFNTAAILGPDEIEGDT